MSIEATSIALHHSYILPLTTDIILGPDMITLKVGAVEILGLENGMIQPKGLNTQIQINVQLYPYLTGCNIHYS